MVLKLVTTQLLFTNPSSEKGTPAAAQKSCGYQQLVSGHSPFMQNARNACKAPWHCKPRHNEVRTVHHSMQSASIKCEAYLSVDKLNLLAVTLHVPYIQHALHSMSECNRLVQHGVTNSLQRNQCTGVIATNHACRQDQFAVAITAGHKSPTHRWCATNSKLEAIRVPVHHSQVWLQTGDVSIHVSDVHFAPHQ